MKTGLERRCFNLYRPNTAEFQNRVVDELYLQGQVVEKESDEWYLIRVFDPYAPYEQKDRLKYSLIHVRELSRVRVFHIIIEEAREAHDWRIRKGLAI